MVLVIGEENNLKEVQRENEKNNLNHLRNEFHFSGVHGAMNRSGSRAK